MGRRLPVLLVIIVCAATTLTAQKQASSTTSRTALAQNYARLPLSFEANEGQFSRDVRFRSSGAGYTLLLTANQAVLSLQSAQKSIPPQSRIAPSLQAGKPAAMSGQLKPANAQVLQMTLVGAKTRANVVGLEELPGKSNYFIGNDPKKWRTNVPSYAKVKYQDVYRGINLVYYGNQNGQLEYDFIVTPGADPNAIVFAIAADDSHSGAGGPDSAIRLEPDGDIVLHGIRFQKPVVYQEDAIGRKRYLDGRYVLKATESAIEGQRSEISFSLADYDHSKPLVIDPAITYSTYLGGTTNASSGSSVAVFTDPSTGHVYAYVTGQTCASDFPAVNAEQTAYGGGCDAFVTKFDPAASGAASLIYSTFLGGSGPDGAHGIAVDSAGNAYITGVTGSANFPLANAYQPLQKSVSNLCGDGIPRNAFLTKLGSDGSTLMYSTYFGGSICDSASAIALDSGGRAYIAGGTFSPDLPTVNPFQSSLQSANGNAFVAAFDTTRSGSPSLLYSTYFGGSSQGEILGYCCSEDAALAVVIDSAGGIHLGGYTNSFNFPIFNGFQTAYLAGEFCPYGIGFYAKLTPSGVGAAQLVYSTYLGGCGDRIEGIAVDSSGNAYLTGHAGSVFPVTTGSLQSIPSGSDAWAFAAKINPSLAGSASLVYSTFVAPAGGDTHGIAVDANGNAFVVGVADPGMPLVNPVQTSANGVMQSINGGQTWTGLTNGLTDFPILALAVDPSTSPRTLYAGSTESEFAIYGTGSIFATTDGGLNWNKVFQVPGTSMPSFLCPGNVSTSCVDALAVDPTTPSNVYAGTNAGVYRSIDRGATWTAFNSGITLSGTGGQGVRVLSFDGGTLYAGADNGLYELSPGATSWTATTLTVSVLSIATDPTTSPHTLYTAGGSGSFKSTDGGQTWTEIAAGVGDGGGLQSLGADTTTAPPTLYGCNASAESNGDPDLFKSTDGGNTWLPIVPFNFFNGCVIAIAVDTTTRPSTVYFRDLFSGIYKTSDGGNTWSDLLPAPTGSIALDSTTASPSTPATVYASTSLPLGNAFVMELNPTGSSILFSTYLGGVGIQAGASGIALDFANNIYVAGTFSESSGPGPAAGAALNTFPAVNAYQSTSGGPTSGDAFFTKLGSQNLPPTSGGPVTTQVGVQTGTLAVTLPNISGSTTSSQPTLTVTPLSSAQTANFSLSNNLGAYDISTTASFSGSVTLCFQALTVNDPNTFSNLRLLHIVNGMPVDVTTSRDFNTRTVCGSVTSLSPFVLVSPAPPPITWSNPQNIVYGTPLGSAQLNATADVPGTFTYTPIPGTVLGPGSGQTLSVTFTPTDTLRYTTSTKVVMVNVLYATTSCDGDLGHTILQPINADGSSVFKLGSTVPTKFRVCNAKGVSVGAPGTIVSYRLIGAGASTGLTVDEQTYSTTADTTFRWDATNQQWILNQGTGKNNPTLSQSNTIYVFRITLNDGTYIQFQYGLR